MLEIFLPKAFRRPVAEGEVDEFVMQNLKTYEKRSIKNIQDGDVDTADMGKDVSLYLLYFTVVFLTEG